MSVTVLLSLRKGARKLEKRAGNGAGAPRTLDLAADTLKSLWTRTRILRKTYQSLSHSTTMKLEERYAQNISFLGVRVERQGRKGWQRGTDPVWYGAGCFSLYDLLIVLYFLWLLKAQPHSKANGFGLLDLILFDPCEAYRATTRALH